MGKHGTLIFKKSMPFLFVATVSSLFYLLCLKLGSMDFFQSLLSKMGRSLGSRVLLSRGLGCEGGLLLVLILAAFGIFDETIMNMTGGNETVNQGPHRGDAGSYSTDNSEADSGSCRQYLNLSSDKEENAGPSESSSSWRKYLNLSSDKEEKAESEASTARVPQPSTSSSWSGSWIEKSPEGSSAAPNQGQQPQGAPEASTGTSSRAHQPAGPSQSEAGGPLRVSPSSPSSPSPSWFEGAEISFQKRLGDQGEVSSAAQNERQQGEGALFQPTPPVDLPQPPLVGEQPGPSYSEQNNSAGDFDFNSEELRSLALHCLESSPEPGEEANSLTPQGAPEALPQAPAPTEDPDLITREIITKMREFDPGDPWDPENPLIRGEKIFPGGRGISNIRPMTVEELKQLRDHLNHGGKKSYWAKELRRRIRNWDWKNPRGPS